MEALMQEYQENFWNTGGASLHASQTQSTGAPTQHKLEHSYGSFTVEKTQHGVAIEVARKSSYHQNSLPQSRKEVNQDRAIEVGMHSGTAYVDNLHQATGAVRYEDTSPLLTSQTIYANLCQVRDSLGNQTLEEMMPDHQPQIELKLSQEIDDVLTETQPQREITPGFRFFPHLGERDPPPEDTEE